MNPIKNIPLNLQRETARYPEAETADTLTAKSGQKCLENARAIYFWTSSGFPAPIIKL